MQPLWKPPQGVDGMRLDTLSREHRREAERERDGWYMSREEFVCWCKAMGQTRDK